MSFSSLRSASIARPNSLTPAESSARSAAGISMPGGEFAYTLVPCFAPAQERQKEKGEITESGKHRISSLSSQFFHSPGFLAGVENKKLRMWVMG
ncbi:MAG: hypothetical protein U0Y68_12020 [Blastocatellia bacterium]